MTHELKRPLLFNVQPTTRRPVLGVVSQHELARLDRRLELRGDSIHDGRDDNSQHRQQGLSLPSADTISSPRRVTPSSVALPLVRSPRPEKPVYMPSPSKTPQYFRWKRPAPPGHKTPSKPAVPRLGPAPPSPRVSPWRDNTMSSESARPSSLVAIPPGPSSSLRFTAPIDSDPFPLPPSSASGTTLGPSETVAPSPWRRSSLFQYIDPLASPPVTPKSALSDVSTPAATAGSSRSADPAVARSHSPQNTATVSFSALFETTTDTQSNTQSSAVVNAMMTATGSAIADPPERSPVNQQPQQFVDVATPSLLSLSSIVTYADLYALTTNTVESFEPFATAEAADATTPPRQRSPTPELELALDDSESSVEALTSPLVLQRTRPDSSDSDSRNTAPAAAGYDMAITQHVRRGAFLRKYLHANNLTRRLKETEQQLRTAAAALDTDNALGLGRSRHPRSLRKRSMTSGNGSNIRLGADSNVSDDEPALRDGSAAPVLRRLSSIDKAINKTVSRIRRLSGIETAAASGGGGSGRRTSESQQQQPQLIAATTNTPAPHLKTKHTSLRAIAETSTSSKQQPQQAARKRSSVTTAVKRPSLGFAASTRISGGDGSDGVDSYGGDSDDGDALFGSASGVHVDPSSAHMLRICQHVIAKRAIQAFVHETQSVVHVLEVALRDDASIARSRSSARTPATAFSHSSSPSSSGPNTSDHVAVRAMSVDMVEAVAEYLTPSDMHRSVDELFATALQAERCKRWKRAILLASAYIVIDRTFTAAVLLRARCCRRLGLWTQTVNDLAHAVALVPDDPRLWLLRAYVSNKIGDLDSALADVDRALALAPTSTHALLLRAAISHRQHRVAAALQDLTAVLALDPSCWRAYYDRATLRLGTIESDDELSRSYDWARQHVTYDALLVCIIEDYINALRKGCKLVEVVETVGDLTVRLMEVTDDRNVLRQVVQSLALLVKMLSIDRNGSFFIATTKSVAAAVPLRTNRSLETCNRDAPLTTIERELLVAALHAQRGRLFVLFGDIASARTEFEAAVVSEYHYPVAHFYRGACATLAAAPVDDDNDSAKTNTTGLVQHLTRSIALDPTIAGAYAVRGALYLRARAFSKALQDFQAAVTTDPTLDAVWLEIALIYLIHYHDCDACIRACNSALTHDACLARALYVRAEAYTRQGNTAAALRDYSRLTLAAPDDRWTHLVRGRVLLHRGLARPALYSFIQFIEPSAAAGDKRAHVLCGRAYKLLARFRSAVDAFARAVALERTSANLVLLSESLHALGDTANALRVSEQVIERDPHSAKGYVRRAQLLVTTGRFDRALGEYDTALALAPTDGCVYYERGIVQMQLYLRWRTACRLNNAESPRPAASSATALDVTRRCRASPFESTLTAIDVEMTLGADAMHDEATVRRSMTACLRGSLADFGTCMRLEPQHADPYVDRAALFALDEAYDKAFRDLDAALARDPTCVRAYVNRGVLKCHFAAFAAAIDDFDKAIQCDNKLALAFFNRGVAYHKLVLAAQAASSYSTCIALSGAGRDVDAHRNRALARCQLRDFAGALADLDQVQQSAPDDDALHNGRGYVLLQLGRYEDAATAFATYGRQSRDTLVDSGTAYYTLATHSEQLDDATHRQHLTTALRCYVRAARIDPTNHDVRLYIASCLRELGDCKRAIAQCDGVLAITPLHHGALEAKALALDAAEQLDDAVACMSAAVRACVASSSSLASRFYAFERSTFTSRDSSEQAVEASTAPSQSTRAISSGHTLSAATTDVIDANVETEPQDALKQPALQTAETVKHDAAKQRLALYLLNRGVLYEKRGDRTRARQDYTDAVHWDPHSSHAHLYIGTLELLGTHYNASVAHLGRALALECQSAAAHINMGVAFVSLRDHTQALTHFDAALAVAPTCSFVHANKAAVLAARGDVALAEYHLTRAIEALPSRASYYVARGNLIAQQRRLQDAMVDFSTALYLGYEGKL